ncbi:MAG: hypothetical protein EOO38_22925 [Cytophagaceae bacterium]|nr:MAG: hypothetical protein EOO38_22925 [Cytophagaceae bacterium]
MGDLFNQTLNKPPFLLPDGQGYSCIWDELWNGFRVTIPHGSFFYSEKFFNQAWSDRAVEYFLTNERYDWSGLDWRSISADELESIEFKHIKWRQDYIKLYGKSIPLPRLTAWYGDPGKSYRYSAQQRS